MDSTLSFYRGSKVVVTGGLGFIGSNLARRLVEIGADVLVVDSMLQNTGANCANLKGVEDRLRIRVVDLRKGEEIASLLPGHNVVFNLAGTVSHLDSMNDPLSDMGANVHAQIVLLEACRQRIPEARIVFASTRQIYGRPISCPVNESHPIRPVDVNGIHKAAAEGYHTLYHQVYGLQTVSLRLTNTYGPRMRVKDARQTFLGVWIRRVVEGGTFEVWGGQQKRDLTYVDDAVDAFLVAGASATAQGRVFNTGGVPPITLTELAKALVAVAGTGNYEIRQFPAERMRIDIGDYFADDELFRQVTGWAPKVTLQSGLASTVDYFRDCLADYV
ncbi:MAG TPA: NAD-dependent epimerase/dehydratase family protein [Candidatus Sulfotelmatobacter sp.]|jgi:UDP-glucose 4-epimerase|nr:NAD-dependent epimerase/dehydratase family protein [Candidatus Sulfotelmatobacter sp.]